MPVAPVAFIAMEEAKAPLTFEEIQDLNRRKNDQKAVHITLSSNQCWLTS
jgi:hypothetical protein